MTKKCKKIYHPSQNLTEYSLCEGLSLSLAIPPRVDAMSTGDGLGHRDDVNKFTDQYGSWTVLQSVE